ncbi:MAG: hypothetical protein ACLTW9_01930 [Enterocloster sp.]
MKDTLVIGMEHKKFAFDRNIEPVAAIHSGDRVIFETEDANVSLITKESDIWAEFPKLYDKGGGCNSRPDRFMWRGPNQETACR